jgi:hypothetical protein
MNRIGRIVGSWTPAPFDRRRDTILKILFILSENLSAAALLHASTIPATRLLTRV